jgi:hypothetical protein
MIRNRLVIPPMAALVAVVLVLGPARSADPEVKTDDTKRMVELLDKIEKRLANQQTQTDVLMEIVRKDLKDLRDEVSRLQKEVTDLRRMPAAPGTSTSNYPSSGPSTSMSPAGPPPTARVRLVNTYPADMTAVVNGMTYLVPAFQTREVPVPAGVATYQIPQLAQPPQTRALTPNETLTLTLFAV